MAERPADKLLYRVTGMDCPSCASKIEKAARSVEGVRAVHVSLVSQELRLTLSDPGQRPRAEEAIRALGYHLDPLDPARGAAAAQLMPGYRRALWLVVVLNFGYGLVEVVGGFWADSQALKADALDFLGDGLISGLGLAALGWSLPSRARSALLQGLFLAVLGLGVLGNTVYRMLAHQPPEAELMGLFGGVALAINLAAAWILIPYRQGDSNMKAVWLFSRNDAIGNLAVVVAAGLVAWSGSSWPDLVVAVMISGLFLHASRSIVTDALQEMRKSEDAAPTASSLP